MTAESEPPDIGAIKISILEVQAEDVEVENRVRRGELTDKEVLIRRFSTLSRQHRDRMGTVAVRHAAALAAQFERPERLIMTTIAGCIERLQTRISDEAVRMARERG